MSDETEEGPSIEVVRRLQNDIRRLSVFSETDGGVSSKLLFRLVSSLSLPRAIPRSRLVSSMTSCDALVCDTGLAASIPSLFGRRNFKPLERSEANRPTSLRSGDAFWLEGEVDDNKEDDSGSTWDSPSPKDA